MKRLFTYVICCLLPLMAVAAPVSRQQALGRAQSFMQQHGLSGQLRAATGTPGKMLSAAQTELLAVPTATTEATADSPVGEYAIIVSGGEAENYALSYQDGVLTVKVPSDIATLLASGQPFDVFNVHGLLVRHQVTTLKGLPRGVYIVGGRKVVVK